MGDNNLSPTPDTALGVLFAIPIAVILWLLYLKVVLLLNH